MWQGLFNLSFSSHRDEKYVALKVVKSAPHYIETAADEIRLLEAIRDADPMDVKRERIVRLMNHFTVRGVNGMHTCLVFEALGCSLYKLIVKNNYQGLAIAQVRNIIRQVLEGLDYLHSKCSIIHTDIKPENILLVIDNAAAMNQQIDDEINSLRVKGADFPDSYSKYYTLLRGPRPKILIRSSAVSSIEKQTKSRAKWPLIEPNGSTNTNTNTSNSTANNSNSSTPLAAVIMSSLDKEDANTTTSSTLNSNTTSSLASKYSSLLGDSECNGGLGGSANLNNRYRAEKKITAKVSPGRTAAWRRPPAPWRPMPRWAMDGSRRWWTAGWISTLATCTASSYSYRWPAGCTSWAGTSWPPSARIRFSWACCRAACCCSSST